MDPEAVQLLAVLNGAACADASLRGPALKRLQELEQRPGLVTLLLRVYSNASVEPQGRFLSIVMCKNVIDRQWQPRSGQSIGDGEKRQVRQGVLEILRAAAAAGGTQHITELSMVMRRICRFDFPRNWGELTQFFTAELGAVGQRGFDDGAVVLVTGLHHVLKEQATKKLIS